METFTAAERRATWPEVQVGEHIHEHITCRLWLVTMCFANLLYDPVTCSRWRRVTLQALVSECDIFSPNELEAESLVGPGTPWELTDRCVLLSSTAHSECPSGSCALAQCAACDGLRTALFQTAWRVSVERTIHVTPFCVANGQPRKRDAVVRAQITNEKA